MSNKKWLNPSCEKKLFGTGVRGGKAPRLSRDTAFQITKELKNSLLWCIFPSCYPKNVCESLNFEATIHIERVPACLENKNICHIFTLTVGIENTLYGFEDIFQ